MSDPQDALNVHPSGLKPARQDRILHFGAFSFNLSRHLLFEHGAPVRLGSRATAILGALLDRPGSLVTKEELVRVAWPETFVEEVNLRVHLAAIRRALHDSAERPAYVANVSGRGYRFVAQVSEGIAERPPDPAPPPVLVRPAQLPGTLVQLVGRDQAVLAVAAMVTRHRLVSIVGPGGVGKTALATAVAWQVAGSFADGAALLDLAGFSDGRQLARELEGVLEAGDGRGNAVNKLVVIDNCDELIEGAAIAAEALLRSAPRVHILATSGEPLRIAAEHIYRLAPLELPQSDNIDLEEALAFSAVRMLAERIRAGNETLRLAGRDVRRLVAISRKLDGLPLAIDMAAANIQVFGLGEVLTRLEQGIDLLAEGRRTVAPRHRTMRNLFERNHDALGDDERVVLWRLSIFAGAFDLGEACAVASCQRFDARRIVSALGGLVAKSQLSTSHHDRSVRYRLTRPLRVYANEQLASRPELSYVSGRHAEVVLTQIDGALDAWQTLSRAEWLDRHGELVDEARQALAWCFSPGGDERLGVRLASQAAPLLLRAGHHDEMQRYASAALTAGAGLPAQAQLRLHLQLAMLAEDHANSLRSSGRHLIAADRLRRQIAAAWAEAELLLVRSALALRLGRLDRAVALARRGAGSAHLAGGDELGQAANRLAAEAHHFAGEHRSSAHLAATLLAGPRWTLPAPLAIIASPHKGAIRTIEARRLWLEGKAEQSRHLVFEALNFAAEHGPWPLCEALGLGACPLLLCYGEDDRAMTHIAQLEREAEYAGLPHWASWAGLYRKVMIHIAIREGRRSEVAIPLQPMGFLQGETWATLTGSLRGLRLSPETASGWCRAEIIRVSALAAIAGGDVETGARRLQDAIALARTQRALAWELRAAMSLARLWQKSRRPAALDLLGEVYGRFDEGRATSDLLAARGLLRRLATIEG